MIHEAMILEYSGRYLALLDWADMMKLMLFFSLGFAAFCPWGIALDRDIFSLLGACILFVIKLIVGAVVLVAVETGLAKMRIFRLPEYLGSAFLFAMLGVISFFLLE